MAGKNLGGTFRVDSHDGSRIKLSAAGGGGGTNDQAVPRDIVMNFGDEATARQHTVGDEYDLSLTPRPSQSSSRR
jgi:hypothetical protein